MKHKVPTVKQDVRVEDALRGKLQTEALYFPLSKSINFHIYLFSFCFTFSKTLFFSILMSLSRPPGMQINLALVRLAELQPKVLEEEEED